MYYYAKYTTLSKVSYTLITPLPLSYSHVGMYCYGKFVTQLAKASNATLKPGHVSTRYYQIFYSTTLHSQCDCGVNPV